MKYLNLVPGAKSSLIGFGCAPIMGSVDRATALRAMNVAMDAGITHFDVAPSYGYGEAEKGLGEFLSRRRSDAVVCTKFGIEANLIAKIGRPFKPVLRKAIELVRGGTRAPGGGAGLTGSIAARAHAHVEMTPDKLVKSLESSLKKLRTEVVDILFLHEPAAVLADPDGMFEVAARLKTQGKLRGFGIALMQEQMEVHRAYIDRFDVLQFNRPTPGAQYDATQAARGQSPNVMFSPFRTSGEGTFEVVRRAPADTLRDLHRDFPQTVVLCSMFSSEHIRQNAAAIS